MTFLTVLGSGRSGSRPPTPGSLGWFGPVGALVGALVGLTWWGSAQAWSPFLAAVLALGADLVITGMLHLDGLADAADGLLAHLGRSRRVAVMAAPEVGAFAVGTVVTALLLRTGGLAALPVGWQAVAFVGGTWAAARTIMATAVCVLPSARPGGLASTFAGATPWVALLVGVPLALAGAAAGRGVVGVVAVTAGVTAGTGVLALARRRIGGVTGDVLGAAGIVGETVALVVAAADW
jgi:adenosylcobinamide-GDP ribazoletransferase